MNKTLFKIFIVIIICFFLISYFTLVYIGVKYNLPDNIDKIHTCLELFIVLFLGFSVYFIFPKFGANILNLGFILFNPKFSEKTSKFIGSILIIPLVILFILIIINIKGLIELVNYVF